MWRITASPNPLYDFSELPLDNSANQNYLLSVPCPQEGRLRDRHGTWGAGCDGRCDVSASQIARAKRSRRTAKSCGPGAATLASSCPVSPGWRRWQERPLHRGEHEAVVKTIARGKPV